MNSENNTVLITGGNSGIGLALTHKFLLHKNKVIVIGRNRERLNCLSKEHPQVITYQCDLSQAQELETLASWVKEKHQDLNILINNAGIQYNYYLTETKASYDKIYSEINTNFSAPIYLTHLLVSVLARQKSAAVINISSGLALAPKEQAPVYCGTKAAIHIYTKTLRYQLENTSVKVFEIISPLVDTPMTKGRGKGKISPDQLVDEFLKAFKHNRYEINIGKVKLLRFIQRISPAIADKILRNGV